MRPCRPSATDRQTDTRSTPTRLRPRTIRSSPSLASPASPGRAPRGANQDRALHLARGRACASGCAAARARPLRPQSLLRERAREWKLDQHSLAELVEGTKMLSSEPNPPRSPRTHPRRRAGQRRGQWSLGRSCPGVCSANELSMSFLSLPTSWSAGRPKSRMCLVKSEYTVTVEAPMPARRLRDGWDRPRCRADDVVLGVDQAAETLSMEGASFVGSLPEKAELITD